MNLPDTPIPDDDASDKFKDECGVFGIFGHPDAAALKAGGYDEGAPGLRDHTPNYYGAYIKDLDGNKIHIYKIL